MSVPDRSAATGYTAEELGCMTPEQLDAIRHCRRCLESYERCVCMERSNRES